MNKNAIKKFAIEARKKLIDSVTDKAGMLGITEKSCSEPITKGVDFEVYQTVAGTEVTLNKRQCEQRRRLVSQIHSRGFEAVVEEVAYTWFNRICAIRFMEVNDYLPNRVRVLSSEKEGKMEPDLVTQAPDVDLDLTTQEKEEIINWKLSGTSEDTDKLYCKLFLKQCHQLHDILPGLFEADSDYIELLFGISYTNKDDVIYMLVNPDTGIPENDFNVSSVDEEGNPTGQVEIIGWLYQYYNTELKDDTFAKLKKNIKITKERIPAATQLFTPDWIVRYMVENSVGRIWIEHLRAVDPTVNEKKTAERFGWKYYLPEAEQEESVNVKLAEIRSNYKNLKPTDITCIDPCMGSGHILIAMFDVLMDIYESAGYDKREAAFEIVEHNIHGLDIDQRAYQLAYFSVMMKGRGYNRRFLRGRDGKPEPKVYAIAESNGINRNHLKFFGAHLSDMERDLAVMQIERLLDIFVDAREYGSILNVDACDWEVIEKYVDDLDSDGQISFESVGSEETQEQLRNLIKVAKNLEQKYDAVVTNPPYMGATGMGDKLSKYVKDNYPDSKSDLFAVFIEKCGEMVNKTGYYGMITQPSFVSLSSFEKIRIKVLNNSRISSLIHMGRGIFGIDFGSLTFVISSNKVEDYKARFFKLYNRTFQYIEPLDIEKLFLLSSHGIIKTFCFDEYNTELGIDVHKSYTGEKLAYIACQDDFKKIPGYPIVYWLNKNILESFKNKKINNYGTAKVGIGSGNTDYFLKLWYEVRFEDISFKATQSIIDQLKYVPINKGGNYRKWYGNNEYVINWENDGYELKNYTDKYGKKLSYPRNLEFQLKESLTWGDVASRKFSMRYSPEGYFFSDVGNSFFVYNRKYLFWILAYCNTDLFNKNTSVLNQTMHFKPGNLLNMPISIEEERISFVDKKVSENIGFCKTDWDSFETSWEFTCHPFISVIHKNPKFFDDISNIDLAEVYICWENECNERFSHLKANEEELNNIFIHIYGLQDELTPEVEDKDVTVRKADLGREIRSLISYAVGCMFGRYSLNTEGLIYAGGKWDDSKYSSFIPDKDNILPITDEEYFLDDIVGRFVEFVKTVYGPDTLEENLDFIAKALGNKGDTSREVIRNYFLKDFYADHLKVYQKRPIYWLFDSGKENGFKALIYMHRYDVDTVGRVRTDYLHRAQKYVETAMQSAQYTIDNATSASEKSKATKAVTKYTKQLAEMKIYDEAIAHIANKRIEIDLDDGVKVNYEKFQGVEVAQEGKKSIQVNLLAKI
ncbi:BREX-1 system adenine-specific DNA-methyltransferase PglX [Bariatricus sp. HCP28S3_A7]|uniref:BREX-1 system adenine-specific DNA-methyltransferase PglX n=1 Tax=Bariatricus sp. HCP28S3_A7 TaxID=3438894 RepID=UPI003F895274